MISFLEWRGCVFSNLKSCLISVFEYCFCVIGFPLHIILHSSAIIFYIIIWILYHFLYTQKELFKCTFQITDFVFLTVTSLLDLLTLLFHSFLRPATFLFTLACVTIVSSFCFLVTLGCCDKLPSTGCLINNKRLLLTVLQVQKAKAKVPAASFIRWGLGSCIQPSSWYFLTWCKWGGVLW